MMSGLLPLLFFTLAIQYVAATPLLWDGRVPLDMKNSDLDTSTGPFLTVVKGSENATHYSKLLGILHPPTPLWDKFLVLPTEQAISMTIDNSSIFIPGGSTPQNGFRRGEFIAQPTNPADGDHNSFNTASEIGTTVYHFSIQRDEARPLNYDHEYQIVWIEPNDGSHVFGIQLGSPFTDPTGPLPEPNAHSFKVLDHALNVLFTAPFTPLTWHNFAVQVDWDNRTLKAFYSTNDNKLKAVTGVAQNPTTPAGAAGQGDFHFGVLKLPLVNLADTPVDQGDVVHFGIQEGTREGLVYSGVFIEMIDEGISTGNTALIQSSRIF